MIRINLLPVKAAKKREAGQRQLLITVLGLAALCLAVAIFHWMQTTGLDDLRRDVGRLQTEIDELRRQVGDMAQLTAQQNELVAQDRVIAQLRAGQTGPLWVMRELSQSLSVGGQPSVDPKAYEELIRRDPSAAYNPTWDPRRLVLTAYGESQGSVKIEAEASDNADVAEFLKRLALSKYFQDVRLVRAETISPTAGAFKHSKFAVNCRVTYK